MPRASRTDAVQPEVALNRAWAQEVFAADRTAGLPFSFVFGGRHSSELVNAWKRQAQKRPERDGVSGLTLRLTDPTTGLQVRAECTVYEDTAGVDWTVYLTNTGTEPTPVIEQVRAVDAVVAADTAAPVVLHRLNGSVCAVDDWLPFDQPVAVDQRIEFAATNGRSSNVSPWFALAAGGGGVITAIGWSGQWCASVQRDGSQVRLQAGLQDLRTVLQPGESLRTPRILQLRWQGEDLPRAYNLFRRTMLAHIMPRVEGKLVLPPIVHLSTSFYELNDSNEDNVRSHLESIRGLGFEMFWLDAYWTGPSGFPDSMGSYGLPVESVEPRDRFPGGLRSIGDAVAREGLGYVMWFEPERVVAGTRIAREHPEWVISPAGDGGGLLHLGLAAARQYMTDYLNAAIKAYRLSCLRIDYNIDPLEFWRFADAGAPDRAGMTEMRYVEGLYRMWDDNLEANPHLFIDDCASGGRRIDLETMSRSVPLWRSDNTCDMVDRKPATVLMAAIKNQVMSAGLNRYVPYSTAGQMGATPYLFRSGYNAGIAFVEDVRPKDYRRDLLEQGIAEAKRLRAYCLDEFFPLIEVTASPRDWCVLQYHRPEKEDGMVLAFRRHESPYRSCECALRQIVPTARYHVELRATYGRDMALTMKGADLQKLALEIDEKPGSLLVEYAMV